jgi:ABC-type multidrug transport system permease subunit
MQEEKYEIIEAKKWHYHLKHFVIRHKYNIIFFKIVLLTILFVLFAVGMATVTEI